MSECAWWYVAGIATGFVATVATVVVVIIWNELRGDDVWEDEQ